MARSRDGASASRPDGAARVAEWLRSIADAPEHARLAELLAPGTQASWLTATIAEGSPYLWELAQADAARLLRVIANDPDAHFADILSETKRAAIAADGDDPVVMRLLRRMKAEAGLLVALADIGGTWPVMRVTQALTELADTAIGIALKHLFSQAAKSGRLRPLDSDDPEAHSGYFVLAMGKMGAFELNYSSDIDLIVFYDPSVDQLAPGVEAAPFYVRITRGLVKLLHERTGDGYVFRTDLRLRPDPASTQIAISTPAALDYYESTGQNWERAAMIKARPCAGDIEAGEAFLKAVSPFIWRKYLDFAAVADVHAMKRQIHAYRGHSEIAVEGHNVKLGRGGIREIEFFAQTQQLIAGGRHPELRRRETLATLDDLAADGWIDADARDELHVAYKFLRCVEHRLQMVADEQTHTLPSDRAVLESFARFMGYSGRDAFAEVLLGHLRKVQHHYATLFENVSADAQQRDLHFPPDKDSRETLDKLSEMGFRQPLEVSATVRKWLGGSYRSLRGQTAQAALADLVPLIIDQFARSESPDAALAAFDHFLAGLHGSGRLFSLLRQNTDLLALLTLVIGTAPRLADTLSLYPQVMDAVIDPSFFGPMPDEAELTRRLGLSLDQSASYEDYLERIRMFAQEHMFLTGTRILSGTLSAEQAGDAFARLADVLVRSLSAAVIETFSKTHGVLPGQKFAVVAMGKLGGREMTATSDLDLLVIYDFEGEQPQSDGERPLYASQYFARLTQRLIGALTARTNYGVLYDVDLRLRPSGRSGPLATSIASFRDYQENEAWTWEHLALTRARVITASPGFGAQVEDTIRNVLGRARDKDVVAADVVEMRRAIATERGDKDRWNLKYAAGGLVDIEFIAQYLQLAHGARRPEILDMSTGRVLDRAWRLGLLTTEDAEALRPAVRLYQDLTQILRLCLPGPFDPKVVRKGLFGLLTRAADVPDFAALEAFLVETQERVRKSFIHILGDDPAV